MPQQTPLLDQMIGQTAPIATGLPPSYSTGFEGLPFMSNPMAAMFLQPMLGQVMASQGLAPMGLSDQNVYDTMRARQFQMEQMRLLQMTAQMDSGNWVRTARGIAEMTGTPWGPDQMIAARALADAGSNATPMLAMMAPGLLDAMGGRRGSAAVMANQMFLGGRYRIDPVTGRMGLSADTTAQMAQSLYQGLFEDGGLEEMRGLSAGQIGEMFQQLQLRGMVAGRGTVRGPDGTLRLATRDDLARDVLGRMSRQELNEAAQRSGVDLPGGDVSSLNPTDLESLLGDSEVQQRMRAFDADKVKQSIKGYADAVAAVRDIFGDIGRPNAPMNELIGALQAMTMGATSQLSPGQLADMVRQTHQLAQMTGTTLDAAVALQHHAASRASQLGIEPVHAVAAAQGNLAFGGAFRGRGLGGLSSWGRFDPNQMQQMDLNLRVNAAASDRANRAAVVMRLADRFGGFEEGSQAADFVEAVREGRADPEMLNMSDADFFAMLTGARNAAGESLGLTDGGLRVMLRDGFINREYVQRHDLGGLSRDIQLEADVMPRAGRSMSNALRRGLADMIGVDAARGIADRETGQQIVDRIFKTVSSEQFADAGQRNEAIGEILKQELEGTAAGNLTDTQYQMLAEQYYAQRTRDIRRDPGMRAFGNAGNEFELMNPRTIEQTRRLRREGVQRAELQKQLAPLGRGGILRRAVSYLQDGRSEKDVMKMLGTALGGVEIDKLTGELSGPLGELARMQERHDQLLARYNEASTPEQRAAIQEELEKLRADIGGQVSTITDFVETSGLDTRLRDIDGRTFDPNDLSGAARTLATGLGAAYDAKSTEAGELARMMGDPDMAAYARRVGLAGKNVGAIAEKHGDTSKTARRYLVDEFKAAQKADTLEAFYGKYGIEGDDRGVFERDAALLDRSGILDAEGASLQEIQKRLHEGYAEREKMGGDGEGPSTLSLKADTLIINQNDDGSATANTNVGLQPGYPHDAAGVEA